MSRRQAQRGVFQSLTPRLKSTLVALLALGLAGCVSEPTTQETLRDFLSGNAVLQNSPLKIGEYVRLRPQMGFAFHQQDWAGLSQMVLQARFDNDLGWYYLGASAEHLGYPQAAKIYYVRALMSLNHCSGTITGDMCGGSVLPADATAGYRRVVTALGQVAPKR